MKFKSHILRVFPYPTVSKAIDPEATPNEIFTAFAMLHSHSGTLTAEDIAHKERHILYLADRLIEMQYMPCLYTRVDDITGISTCITPLAGNLSLAQRALELKKYVYAAGAFHTVAHQAVQREEWNIFESAVRGLYQASKGLLDRGKSDKALAALANINNLCADNANNVSFSKGFRRSVGTTRCLAMEMVNKGPIARSLGEISAQLNARTVMAAAGSTYRVNILPPGSLGD